MPVIETLQNVGSIPRYLQVCDHLKQQWIDPGDRPGDDETLWFRAQPDEDLGLTPKLYRPEYRGASEADIRQEFQSRATPLIEGRLPQTKYEWYFLMQARNASSPR